MWDVLGYKIQLRINDIRVAQLIKEYLEQLARKYLRQNDGILFESVDDNIPMYGELKI